MPLLILKRLLYVSTHMPLARHDMVFYTRVAYVRVSTHMPLARHDGRR